MEEKKNLGEKLGAFFAGKGYYIVLLLSAAVIATSIWLMAAGSRANVEDENGTDPETITNASAGEESRPVIEPVVPVMEETEEPVILEPEVPAVEGEMKPSPTATPAPESTGEAQETMAAEYFIWPVSGPVDRTHSMEALTYDRTMGDWRTHEGWDIAADLGTPVMAAGDGTVTAVYQDDLYGSVVEIDHGNGLTGIYANLNTVPTVNVGDQVEVGQVIGAVGTTALCEIGEACHLHFAMRQDGVSVDPGAWLPER